MATYALPIDFDAVRIALVRAVSVGTGLPESQVIMLEGEGLDAPRPKSPYFGILITTPSIKAGFDWMVPVPDEQGQPTGLFYYRGPRTMNVSFDCFARTHELAYGLMSAWQSALDQGPTLDALDFGGMSVADIGAVADLSALLNTSFEGRAHLDVSFGLMASVAVNVGQIATVPLTSQIHADGRVLTSTTIVTKEG